MILAWSVKENNLKNSNRFITRAPRALELQLPGKDGYKMSQTHKKGTNIRDW
jgi:hypothetical protein